MWIFIPKQKFTLPCGFFFYSIFPPAFLCLVQGSFTPWNLPGQEMKPRITDKDHLNVLCGFFLPSGLTLWITHGLIWRHFCVLFPTLPLCVLHSVTASSMEVPTPLCHHLLTGLPSTQSSFLLCFPCRIMVSHPGPTHSPWPGLSLLGHMPLVKQWCDACSLRSLLDRGLCGGGWPSGPWTLHWVRSTQCSQVLPHYLTSCGMPWLES